MAIADDIGSLETKLNQLKTDYEQYFLGFQKREPERLRSEIDRLIQLYSYQRITNTALNFRYKTVVARYNSYRTYWDRVLREIEEGRYVRDRFKMKLRDKIKEAAPSPAIGQLNFPTHDEGSLSSDDELIKRVYQEYIETRKKTNEPPVKYESVAGLLSKQIPVIKEKYKCSSVDFKVVIEEGKTKLKAVPKK